MKVTSYTVQNVDLDAGVGELVITFENGVVDVSNFSIYSLVGAADATEGEIKAALDSMVYNRIFALYPPIPPKPLELVNMQGKTYNYNGVMP